VEAADGTVVAGQRTLALQHVDLHGRLVIGSRREGLGLFGRDGGVGLDQFGHHPTHGFDTE
jgi:hypothetical protein